MNKLSTSTKIFGLVLVALLIVLAVNVISILSAPSDQQQIKSAIENMRQATLENRPGGVLEYLSNEFQTPFMPDSSANPLSAVKNFIQQVKTSRLEISDIQTNVENGFASSTCQVDADLEFLGMRYRMRGPITIEFRKETSKRLFILPEKKWRVVRVYPKSVSDFTFGPAG